MHTEFWRVKNCMAVWEKFAESVGKEVLDREEAQHRAVF